MEDLSLIDVSGEDDFLLDLASPPQHPDPPPRAATGTSTVGADLVQPAAGSQAAAPRKVLDPSGATEQVPERTESPKKSKPKGGVNLRKSLAWDSAFFTGEGVLDTEELGIVNSTFRKSQGSRLLPGIAEEMRRSSESTTSTIESESFVLESLETELFDNVRASIQRTLGKPGKAPHVTAASSKNSKAPAKAPPVTVRKGVDRISQTQSKIRPPVSTSSGYGAGSKQRPQVTPKEPTAAKVAVSTAAEVKPSSRPPRALPRVATMRTPSNTASTSAISDKRSSTGGVVNRQTVGNSANGSASMSSRPGVGSKTSSTSKSGALSSSVISSLHSEPLGTVHGSKTKSPTLTAKGRAQRIPIRLSSRSDINKVDPARASLRSKIPTRSHGEGASPIISPSSSVDSMSSVVSGVSTASTIGKASHTSETFSTRSSSVSPSTRKSNDHPPTANPRPLTVAEGTSCDSLISSIDTSTHGNGFKPSGLRRPTPKIGYFDPEKSVEQKAARAQLQPMKVLFSPLATPNPPISSTPKKYPSFPTFDQHELMSMAVPPSQTKASPSLPIKVSQPEVELSKVSMAVPPSQTKASPSLPIKVSQPEVELSQVSMAVPPSQTKASPSLPIKVSQPEVETSKVTLHEVALPSQTEASPLLPARVAQTEVESSKVTLHEVALPSQTEASPLLPVRVAQTEVEPCKVHEASPTKAQPSLPLGVAQTEVDPSKAMEHGASQNEASPLLPLRVAQTEAEPSKVMEHEASQTKASSTPLRVAQTEVESSKVLEHEAHMCETDLLVAMDIAEDSIPLPLELSSCTSGQQESGTTAASQMENSPSQSKVSPSMEVVDDEACMPQACPVSAGADTAKENIPSFHQNIHPNGAPSPLKENILASHHNIQAEVDMTPVKGASHPIVQAIEEMTPVTLLTQKLSSISIGPAANGEATPLTLLAQKLSSISLGDATDSVVP